MAKDLKTIRKRLDDVDQRLLDALAERQGLIRDVVAHKAATSSAKVRDFLREQSQLTVIAEQARARGLDAYFATRIFNQLLDHSVRYQQAQLSQLAEPGDNGERRTVVVAFQGRSGAYSEMAAEQHFGPLQVDLRSEGYDSFAAILEAVAERRADYAMLPIENTTAGSINEAYDLLARMDLAVVGEEIVRADHCLVALPGAQLGQIRRVYSHPQGLLQCSNFIATLTDCHAEAFTDTAMSVVKVRDDGDPSQAAIASERAASLYGLTVLAREIANQKHNFTRMMVVARQPIRFDPRIPCKTSLIFATAHSEGALLRCLSGLSEHGLNLTKLESRPRPGVAWEYLFYVDFEGNIADAAVREAIEAVRANSSFLKVLGSYPARTTRQGQPVEPTRALAGASTASQADPGAASTQHIGVGRSVIGGDRPILIAGPPAAESRAQVLACAQSLHAVGADILRAPCFRAPGAPGHFDGAGLAGLAWLDEAAQAVGLPVMTNVRQAQDVAAVAAVANVIEVDGDQMLNFALLEQLGKLDRPVLLRRDKTATVSEWLAAAKHLCGFGNRQVILCEDGVVGPGGGAVLDIAGIAALREQALPVIADPACSVGAGAHWASIGRACLQAGAHGLVISMHPEPTRALTGDAPSLNLDDFETLVRTGLVAVT